MQAARMIDGSSARPFHSRNTKANAAIHRLFRNAEIADIPDAGHWVHAERPEDFLALLAAFLAGPSISA